MQQVKRYLPTHNRDGSQTTWGMYYLHLRGAEHRGIRFTLTFDEWVAIWKASGHFHERGVWKGQYVMARFGDKGAYEVGNVKIVTNQQNIAEFNQTKRGKPRSEEAKRRVMAGKLAAAQRRQQEAERLKRESARGRRHWANGSSQIDI